MELDTIVKALRNRYTYQTQRGLLSTQDLWDLKVSDLEKIGEELSKQIQGTKLFRAGKRTNETAENKEINAKIEILTYIVETKESEALKQKERAEKQQMLSKLKAIAGQKAEEKILSLTQEEIDAQIKEIESSLN